MSSPIKISATICSYNRARFIIQAVESIFNQDYDKNLFEVIVVDNNSTEDVIGVLEAYKQQHPDYNFRYFTETQQGVAHTRTRCAKEARGEIVAYLDDDSEAQPGWLSSMASFFDEHPGVYEVGGRIIPYFLTDIPAWYSKYFFGLVGTFDLGPQTKKLTKEKYPCGANMAFRKKVFDEIGYFNTLLGRSGTGMLATEEKDIFKKVLAAGHEVYYLPDVWVKTAVEANKFDANYVKKHSRGIGGGERLRLKGQTIPLIKKFIEYILKWGYAIAYGIGFLIKGQWSKFVMLERFRWWVIEGFINPKGAS